VSGYRLALLTDSVEVGGAEVFLRTLLAELPDDVHAVVLGQDAAVLDAVVAGRPKAVAEVVSPGLLPWARALRRHRPDVVHANLTTFTACRPGVVAGLALGLPVVLVDHLPMPGLTWKGRQVQRWTTRACVDRIAVGDRAAREVERYGGLAPGTVQTIANGVPGVPATSAPPAEGTCVVGVLGRLDRQKGIDVALRAMVGLEGARLLVMGSGGELAPLRALVDELELSDRVDFWPAARDTEPFWAAVHLLVLPSRAEALPLVLLEALHRSRPIVASDVGSVSEVVSSDVGFLVPPEDEQALRSALARLVGDEQLRRRMGDAGRDAAVRQWTAERMAGEYDAAYRSAAGRRRFRLLRRADPRAHPAAPAGPL
jgi:glycosyltransferase involved in cell wall biosynthesis